MNALYARLILVLMLPLASSKAEEINVATRAPVNCSGFPSCGSGISLEQAKASYDKRAAYLARISQRRSKQPTEAATIGKSQPAQIEAMIQPHMREDPGPVLFKHICGAAESQGYYYFWAPADMLSDGRASFADLSALLRSGRIHNGRIYIQTAESTDKERHYAACNARSIRGRTGPPTECTTVAIATDSEVWLRAGDRNTTTCMAATTLRASGAIQIDFEIETTIGPKVFAQSIATHLTNKYALTTEQEIAETREGKATVALVRSTASLRDSPILGGGWRESFDFDLWIRSGKSSVSVSGRANALVSRQALGNLTQYSGLSDAQRNTYGTALDDTVEEGIRRICKNYKRKDARQIICN